MSRSEIEYLRHIRDEARYSEETSQEVSWEEFVDDETLKRAFVRSIEVIGEATKNLSAGRRKRHPDVEWRAMAGMRDQLIHGYFGVDYEIVWEVTTEKVPERSNQCYPRRGRCGITRIAADDGLMPFADVAGFRILPLRLEARRG